jgi:hypothetical protein
MITIRNQTARQAQVLALFKRFANTRSASASLTSSTRVNLHQYTSGALSLVREIENARGPRSIVNTLSEHPACQALKVQILDRNQTVGVNQPPRHVVQKVASLIANVVMPPLKQQRGLTPTVRSFLTPGNAPLQSPQFSLRSLKIVRIRNAATVAKSGETAQSDINTYGVRVKRQRSRQVLHGKDRKPTPGLTFDCQCFYLTLKRPVYLDPDVSDLRQSQSAIAEGVSDLSEGQAVVTTHRAKSGITRRQSLPCSLKERVKRQIHPLQYVFQSVATNDRQVIPNFFNFFKLTRLIEIVDGLSLKSPRIAAFLKCGIVKLAAESQLGVQGTRLVNARIESVSEYLNHSIVILHLKYLPA